MGATLVDFKRLFGRKVKVVGVDVVKLQVDLAKEKIKKNAVWADVEWYDGEHLPFEDASFDVVYSFGVLHHTPDTQKAINEVQRVLKKNGKAVIMLYHRRSLNYVAHQILDVPFDGSKKDRCPVERAYTKKEIRKMFSKYSDVHIKIDYLFGTGWGYANKVMPKFLHRALGKKIGWHIVIEAKK